MTVNEAIARVGSLRPGSVCSHAELTKWLEELDTQIWREIILTHEGGEETAEPHYDPASGGDETLLAASPHDRLYLSFLFSEIDRMNGEIARYNNSVSTFNAEYAAFRNAYNAEHAPKTTRLRFF